MLIPQKIPANVSAYFIGLLLLVAAALKAYGLATTPLQPNYWLENRWLQLAAVELEILVGCWLLARIYRGAALRATLFLFVMFAGVTLWKAISGAESCGCFGQVHVNPWYTLIVDVGIVTMLLCTKRAWNDEVPHKRIRLWITGTSAVGVCLIAVLIIWRTTPATHDADNLLPTAGSFIILDPERWIGKTLPLLDQIDAGPARLDQGVWVVVMYHADCATCLKAIAKYVARAKSTIGQSEQIVFVEIPPYAKKPILAADTAGTLGRLRETHEWFAQTPLALRLEKGQVVKAREGDAAVEPDTMFTP